jgi:ABC-type uncharacterized transport system permease subunit
LFRRRREIWYAFIAIVAVTALYAVAYRQAGAFPKASGLVGHGIGIVGFILILMTETLYSIRKRLTDAKWGSMASWLRFHIFTGLVGPYMVLLHTSMKFGRLAGVATLLTFVVVASGVVGRYIYTRVPRTVEDTLPAADVVAIDHRTQRLAARRGALATWRAVHVPLTWVLITTALAHAVAALYYVTLAR